MRQTYALLNVQFGREMTHPIIKCTVNDKSFTMLIDTGSDVCHLVPTALECMGYKPEDSRVDGVMSTAGGDHFGYCIPKKFLVLGKEIKSIEVYLAGLPPHIDGIIGMDLLMQFKQFTFDIQGKQLILED